MTWETILSNVYLCTIFMMIAGYYPQIRTLVKDTEKSHSISILAWGIWTFNCIVALLYSVFINGDGYIIFCALVNLLGCLTVFLLTIYNRHFRKHPNDLTPKEH